MVADGPTLAAIVCDGAGSAAKAEQGARTACSAFLDFVRTFPAPTEGEADPALWAAEALASVQDAIARTAAASGDPADAYACTLLAAAAIETGAVFLQVGDGAIAYHAHGEPWRLATTPRRGEFANETIFVTAQHPLRHASVVRIAGVQAFALMSDGVEFLAIHQARLEPHGAFFRHVLAGITPGEGEDEAHSRWLQDFLASDAVNQRTDDDKTLVLVTRTP